jgi:hypothetical protein
MRFSPSYYEIVSRLQKAMFSLDPVAGDLDGQLPSVAQEAGK